MASNEEKFTPCKPCGEGLCYRAALSEIERLREQNSNLAKATVYIAYKQGEELARLRSLLKFHGADEKPEAYTAFIILKRDGVERFPREFLPDFYGAKEWYEFCKIHDVESWMYESDFLTLFTEYEKGKEQ